MGWLSVQRPRGFRHTYLYIDARREQVAQARKHYAANHEPAKTPAGLYAETTLGRARARHRAHAAHGRMMVSILVPLLMLAIVLMAVLFFL